MKRCIIRCKNGFSIFCEYMNFQALFYPKSIAVIGASTQAGSVGNDIVKNLVEQGFSGSVYPVNPKATELYERRCFARIADISEDVDFAVIVVPSAVVLGVVREAIEKGVQAIAVISAGFKEAGNGDAERELKDICMQNDVVLIGPNCLGVINAEISMNASFAPLLPKFGGVAFLSQSGALCASVLDFARSAGIGFSKFVSMGNKAMISETEILEYLAEDESTRVVAIYAEDFREPNRLREVMHVLTKRSKPVIVLKSGRTETGMRAVASHTGSLAGSDAAYDALFDQTGMVRADSFSELFDLMRVFSQNPFPTGNRIAIVTNAGGPGVLTADAAVSNGLELVKFEQETEERLRSFLSASANVHNPVDVLGDATADRYEKTLDSVLADPNVDMVSIVLTPQTMTDAVGTAQAIIRLRDRYKKPLVASFMGDDLVSDGTRLLMDAQVATVRFCEASSRSLGRLFQYTCSLGEEDEKNMTFSNVSLEAVRIVFAETRKAGKTSLPEATALDVFRAYNFPTMRSILVSNAEEAKVRVAEIGERVAMKIVSHDILHKSDVGGVALGVTELNAEKEFEAMIRRVREHVPDARIEGVLLSEMAPEGGLEMIIGSTRDAQLGSVLMIGLGGIYVEVFKDVSFGVVPIGKKDAEHMIQKLAARKILSGTRGGAVLDTEALYDAILRVSQLLSDFPEIRELDINPLLVLPTGQGVRVLDGRISLEI